MPLRAQWRHCVAAHDYACRREYTRMRAYRMRVWCRRCWSFICRDAEMRLSPRTLRRRRWMESRRELRLRWPAGAVRARWLRRPVGLFNIQHCYRHAMTRYAAIIGRAPCHERFTPSRASRMPAPPMPCCHVAATASRCHYRRLRHARTTRGFTFHYDAILLGQNCRYAYCRYATSTGEPPPLRHAARAMSRHIITRAMPRYAAISDAIPAAPLRRLPAAMNRPHRRHHAPCHCTSLVILPNHVTIMPTQLPIRILPFNASPPGIATPAATSPAPALTGRHA